MTTNQTIKFKVLQYLEANPDSKRADIAKAVGLSPLQTGNALTYWRMANQAIPSGKGQATKWTATLI